MKKFLSAIQWLVFHIGVVLSVPIIVGSGFELSPEGIENLMRLTFVITGAGSLLQIIIGHKNLLIEGPAGPWWAAYLVIIGVALPAGKPIELIRTDIQGALIIGGTILFFAGLLGIIRRLQSIFSPRVTGVFLLLIAVQISGIALERMASHGLVLFLISIGVLILSIALLTYSSGMLKQSALLLSVLAGWAAAALSGSVSSLESASEGFITFPEFLPWGPPTFDIGVILNLTVLGLLLIPNQIGSLKAMEAAKGEEIPIRSYDRGLAASGLTSVFAGFTGGVGTTPFAISAGLVSVTQDKNRGAFIIGAVLFILIGIITPLGTLLSTIPASIAGAILLISVASIAVIGIQSLTKEDLSGKNSFVAGISLLTGTGIMFLPAEVWASVPSWAASIFSNGVISGTLAAVFLEQVVFKVKQEG